jgi:hypothetical protein
MMKLRTFTTTLVLIVGAATFAQSFESKVTSASNVRLAISNFATFGNSFDGYRDGSGTPSCEYPAGSGIEHVFEGGLWIGGRQNGADVRVTTAALDNSSGYTPGSGGFETFALTPLEVRSSLFDSRFYTGNAVSHEDFVSVLSDTVQFYPGTSIRVGGPTHQPMGLKITMESYNWNYLFSDFVVFVTYKIENTGSNFYDDLHVGLWNNTVVRNINVTPAGTGGAQFYNKGGNGYLDSINLAYCFDATGDPGFTDSYIGQKFLGATDKEGFHSPMLDSNYNQLTNQWELDNFDGNYQAWVFNDFTAQFAAPSGEGQRLDKMSDGLNQSPCWENPNDPNCPGNLDFQALLNQPGNRSDLISVGPFARFEPGDEVTVTFAYVLAKKFEDGNPSSANNAIQRQNLVSNANFAQETYNGEDVNFNGVLDDGEDTDGDGKITRFVLPTPPATPITKVIAGDGKIDIYWTDNSVKTLDPISNKKDFEGFKIYMSQVGFDVQGVNDLQSSLNLIAQFDSLGNGLFFDTGFDDIKLTTPKTFDGDTNTYQFHYTINNVNNGWQNAVAVTAFDQGDVERNIQSLESSFLANDFRTFSGKGPNVDMEANEPFAYPNPYYYGAAWEGQSNFQEESRKIIFANLPQRCQIRIYTVAGDFIDEINHDQNYNGSDTRWFKTFGSENADDNVFSGGEHAWDLLSLDSQIISRGLYMFSVEDLDSGEKFTGKFVIIK